MRLRKTLGVARGAEETQPRPTRSWPSLVVGARTTRARWTEVLVVHCPTRARSSHGLIPIIIIIIMAVRDFFGDFVCRLDTAVRANMDLDDPTIDLDKCIMDKPRNETYQVQEKRDPSLSELRVIVGQINDKNSYSEKLVGIMLKGLEKTLTSGFYRLFLEGGLPENWCPIVKMNNDNTPFVEFLIKSEISDQDPFSQLNQYSAEHMALSKFVLDHLHASATQLKLAAPNKQHKMVKGSSSSAQSKTFSVQQPKSSQSKENRRSLPVPMTCSTPISQRKAPAKRAIVAPRCPSTDSLNDSKRILPHRACKSGNSGVYRVY